MGKLRDLRKAVLEALTAEPWPSGLDSLDAHPPKALMGPLFACLLEPDALTRWRAATAFGRSMARLFGQKPEDARQLMRQLMWRLNEESGNIAWGTAEAFGETFRDNYAESRRAEQAAFDAWQASHITDFEWQRYFVS